MKKIIKVLLVVFLLFITAVLFWGVGGGELPEAPEGMELVQLETSYKRNGNLLKTIDYDEQGNVLSEKFNVK